MTIKITSSICTGKATFGDFDQLLAGNFSVKRFFSTNNSSIVPLKVYENADSQKLEILAENRGKSGIISRPLICDRIYRCGRKFSTYC